MLLFFKFLSRPPCFLMNIPFCVKFVGSSSVTRQLFSFSVGFLFSQFRSATEGRASDMAGGFPDYHVDPGQLKQ